MNIYIYIYYTLHSVYTIKVWLLGCRDERKCEEEIHDVIEPDNRRALA